MAVGNISSKKTRAPGAPGVPYYTPAQTPPAGTPLRRDSEPDLASGSEMSPLPTLYTPLTIRDVTLSNRWSVSPMCMYSADDGHLTDFHLVHLGSFALRGAALTFVEAASVVPNGRISPEDAGVWSDSHIAPLRRIADFVHSQGQHIGIQLAHAGRKASMLSPQHERRAATTEEGGWADDVWSASEGAFSPEFPSPKALSIEQIQSLVRAFADAAKRSIEAGIDVIEIHAAHGYLLMQFFSPITNKRTDKYGGSFENRTRLLLEVIQAVRAAIPSSTPLFVRISTTEWMEHDEGRASWTVPDSIRLAKLLPDLGVDLLDASSGGNNADQKIKLHPRYQVDIAGQIRAALRAEGQDLLIGAVGLITNAELASSAVQENGQQDGQIEVTTDEGSVTKADIILVARQFLRDPDFVLRTAHELGVNVKQPYQYHRAAPYPKN